MSEYTRKPRKLVMTYESIAAEVREMLKQPDDSDIKYTERELIQRAIRSACARHALDCSDGVAAQKPRWDVVRRAFGCGSTVSKAICYRYGFDAERMIGEL